MNLILQGKLPVADWIEDLTNWLTHTFSGLFNLIQSVGNFIMDGITNTLLFVNPLLLIVLVTLAAFFLARKNGPYQLLPYWACFLSIIKVFGMI